MSHTRWCGPEPEPGDIIGCPPGRPRPGVVYMCAFCGGAVPSDHVAGHQCFYLGTGAPALGRPPDLDSYDPDVDPYFGV